MAYVKRNAKNAYPHEQKLPSYLAPSQQLAFSSLLQRYKEIWKARVASRVATETYLSTCYTPYLISAGARI